MPLRGKALPELGENWLTIEQMVCRPSLKQADGALLGPGSADCPNDLGLSDLIAV
jgi:hypothetical protein